MRAGRECQLRRAAAPRKMYDLGDRGAGPDPAFSIYTGDVVTHDIWLVDKSETLAETYSLLDRLVSSTRLSGTTTLRRSTSSLLHRVPIPSGRMTHSTRTGGLSHPRTIPTCLIPPGPLGHPAHHLLQEHLLPVTNADVQASFMMSTRLARRARLHTVHCQSAAAFWHNVT